MHPLIDSKMDTNILQKTNQYAYASKVMWECPMPIIMVLGVLPEGSCPEHMASSFSTMFYGVLSSYYLLNAQTSVSSYTLAVVF